LILFAQIFISIIFLVSSISKLKSLSNFKETIQELGFSSKMSGVGANFIIIIELIITILILFEKTRLIGEVFLTFILLLFSWSAWRAVRINRKIECNCFGNLSNSSLGNRTFLRIIPIGILNSILFLYPMETSILGSSWTEVIFIMFSSVGILIIYILLTTFYNVTSMLQRR
jgi:uncharacterized membrane protein YphA (DoxX/SURF4 family)